MHFKHRSSVDGLGIEDAAQLKGAVVLSNTNLNKSRIDSKVNFFFFFYIFFLVEDRRLHVDLI